MSINDILSKLFKRKEKKNKMEINEQTIEETRSHYSGLDFQWIKGDDMSMVEKYKDLAVNGDLLFVVFQSGKRMNVELINEFMVTYPALPVDISLPTITSLDAPVHTNAPASAVTSIIYEDQKNSNTDSPIYKLLKKQKKNLVEVSIKIKLNLPPKDLYTVLSGSFDDAEKEIIDFVLDGVDIENIKASLANSIKKSFYNEKNEKPKSHSSISEKKLLETINKDENDDEQ